MNDDIAIKVENVSKTFRLPHEKQNSIKSSLISIVKGGKRSYEKQQVLKDVSFEIKKGEFFGIVGRNGSGKSTLLKMLAGIYTPSKGQIHVNGKLTPFIELGVGFNPELTGRENVFLNGALLGFNRSEMLAMYDDIVDFAELHKFMDQKLKNYSSGMQVRLAFSIAIRAQSEILVLDEVLAVGDESFQKKCLDVFEQYKAQKRTVVLVTHDMDTVKRFCTTAMLIHNGDLKMIGEPVLVAKEYSDLNDENSDDGLQKENKLTETKTNVTLTDVDGKSCSSFAYGDQAKLVIKWDQSIGDVKGVGVAIYKQSGEYISGVNTFIDKTNVEGYGVVYQPTLNFADGKYLFKIGLFGENDSIVKEFISVGPRFVIKPNQNTAKWQGLIDLPHKWR